MLEDALIELTRDSADSRLVANIRLPQTAGRESTDSLRRFQQHDRLPHPAYLNRGCNATGCTPVDHHVVPRILLRWPLRRLDSGGRCVQAD